MHSCTMTMLKSWLFRGQDGAFELILRVRAQDTNAACKATLWCTGLIEQIFIESLGR